MINGPVPACYLGVVRPDALPIAGRSKLIRDATRRQRIMGPLDPWPPANLVEDGQGIPRVLAGLRCVLLAAQPSTYAKASRACLLGPGLGQGVVQDAGVSRPPRFAGDQHITDKRLPTPASSVKWWPPSAVSARTSGFDPPNPRM